MLCERCLREIGRNLSQNAQRIFVTLSNNKRPMLNNREVIAAAGLSYTKTLFAVRELQGATLIDTEDIASATYCKLSKNGNQLKQLLKDER